MILTLKKNEADKVSDGKCINFIKNKEKQGLFLAFIVQLGPCDLNHSIWALLSTLCGEK